MQGLPTISFSTRNMSLTPLDNVESDTEKSFNITHQKSHSLFSPLYAKAENAKCWVKEICWEPVELLRTLVIWLLV